MMLNPQRLSTWWWGCLGGITLALMSSVSLSGQAAERVYLSFSLLERSVAVKDLETFAATGELTGDLVRYARFFNAEQLQQLRTGLGENIEISPVAIAQFLYAPVGQGLLRQVEQVVQTKSGQGSLQAIRSALILAAADREGLTVVSILRHFPTHGVRVDLQAALGVTKAIQQAIQDTHQVVAAIADTAPAPPLALDSQGRALQQRGPYVWNRIPLQFNDRSAKRLQLTGKARKFSADIYVPQVRPDETSRVIVISHGFNSSRSSYTYLAQHLASHGYVVVVPEHAGSNTDHLERFLSGQTQAILDPKEFVDRPLDVSYVLDQLPVRSQIDARLPRTLNLEAVGFIGHSFGGYTGLALTGQPLTLEHLYQSCQPQAMPLNLSLLLQCQARHLPHRRYDLRDDRIRTLLTVSPMGSVLLGPQHYQSIQVPVMVITGSHDTVAPALPEQVIPFSQLRSRDRYLVLIQGGSHFSTTLPDANGDSPLTKLDIGGPAPDVARQYLMGLSLAFMDTHLNQRPAARTYLTAGYAAAVSRPELPLHLTERFTYNAKAAQ